MNYKELLKSKIFNFSKQLLCNLIYSICIVGLVALFIVHFFNYAIYDVFSNSQYPTIKQGDLVVVKYQPNYSVGDIVKFHDLQTGLPIVHRVISIKKSGLSTYFICHGDNVQSVANFVLQDEQIPYVLSWKKDSEFVENLTLEEIKTKAKDVVQIVEVSKIEGKVVATLKGVGFVFRSLKKYCLHIVLSVFIVWKVGDLLMLNIENCKKYFT